MKTLIFLSFLLIGAHSLLAQNGISINTDGTAPHSSAMLDIKSTDKGMLVPRLTEAQRNAIATPATGLLLYQTDNTTGFYYYNGTTWTLLSASTFTETDPKVATTTTGRLARWNGTNLVDGLLFDDGTNVGLGTVLPTEKIHITSGNLRLDGAKIKMHNIQKTISIGEQSAEAVFALNNYTGGIFLGYQAGKNTQATGGNAGVDNIAIGSESLVDNVAGYNNVSIGWASLQKSTGNDNTALGNGTLRFLTSNNSNTAVGSLALRSLVSGGGNTAVGFQAGRNNLGSNNLFLGYEAGYNETGSNRLYMANSNTTTPLLYGEFDNSLLQTNGRFVVAKTVTNEGILRVHNGSNAANTKSWIGFSADNVWGTTDINDRSRIGMEVQGTGAGALFFTTGGYNGQAERMRISQDGSVSIGTTAPSGRFHVALSTGSYYTPNWGVASNTTILGVYASNTTAGAQVRFADTGGVFYDIGRNGAGDFTIQGNDADRFVINSAGNVGIGTDLPTTAKLVVNGSQNNTLSYGYLNSTGATGTIGSSTNAYSIYASDCIAATEFNAYSDARIKRIKRVSNSKSDLATLANIRITDYTHIDSIAKGNKEIKKVIAQELKAVYPQAVSTMTDVIPDIYQTATITEGGLINLPTNLKVGEKVKLILPTGEELVEVTAVGKDNFTVRTDKVGKVFVYGRQVNDFHTVDYEALTTLNVSATQELLKKIENLEAKNKALEAKIDKMEKVEAEVTDLKKQMQDIQLLLQQVKR